MLTNYIRTALRRFGRQKLTTALHLIGLTLGMSACLLIALFLRYEMRFDSYQAEAGRTYRINTEMTDAGEKMWHWPTPTPLADALRSEAPGLEHVVRILQNEPPVIEINPQRRFKQEHVLLTEPEFLDVFDVDVLSGNGHEALRQPYQALLTQTCARKFFGRENPLGKTFKYNNDFTVTVAGVIRDLPPSTHLPASMLVSFYKDEGFLQSGFEDWRSESRTSTYVVLPEGKQPDALAGALKAIADQNINNGEDMPHNRRWDFELQPLKNIHFEAKTGGSAWVQAVNPLWLWFFGCIGLAVLVLACINFVNLSTAQMLTRAKEVGVRKSVGAGRRQLIFQFLTEACLLAFFAGVLAITAAREALPPINRLLDKQIAFGLSQSPEVWGALFLGILMTGLLAGLYPAWVIARFKPVHSLKTGWTAGDKRTSALRRALVVVQFSLSVGLLIALILIGQQMNYMRSKNLGFEKGNTLLVELPWGADKAVFSSELARIPQVKNLSFSTTPPSNFQHWGTAISLTEGDDANRQSVKMILTDEHFCELYEMQLKAGRFLVASDTNALSESLPDNQRLLKCVVNETLVKSMGFASNEAALGQRLWTRFYGWRAEITGVVGDFNLSSLYEEVPPTLISQYSPYANTSNIKLEAGSDYPATLAAIGKAFEKAFPSEIFTFNFLDQNIDAFYKAEARLFDLFKVFAGIAMLISCLGLWGLATFAAEQRRKEIGIRKVLGASVEGIVTMLAKDFLWLVGIAILIASPLAYLGMRSWLQDFAYRIDIHWTVFAMAGLIAVLVAFCAVSFQSLRAAMTNPVESLRNE